MFLCYVIWKHNLSTNNEIMRSKLTLCFCYYFQISLPCLWCFIVSKFVSKSVIYSFSFWILENVTHTERLFIFWEQLSVADLFTLGAILSIYSTWLRTKYSGTAHHVTQCLIYVFIKLFGQHWAVWCMMYQTLAIQTVQTVSRINLFLQDVLTLRKI